MKYNKIIIMTMIMFAVAVFTACNQDEVFEREQYKHVIALKSEGVFKVFNQEIDYSEVDADGFVNGFISASVGGSMPTDQSIKLTVVEDPLIFEQYNSFNFASEAYRYASYIPENRKIINDYSINIPAGERTGVMNIRIRPDGLSPDTVYMLPFRVTGVSAYEMNQDMNTALYRLLMKNEWSSIAAIPQYSHKGVSARIDLLTEQVEVTSFLEKHVHPVSANQVRVYAGGDKIFDENSRELETDIKQWAIKLTVNDGKVTISPWFDAPNGMQVKQIDEPCGGGHTDWKCRICEPEALEDESDTRDINSCYYDARYNNTYAIVDDGWGRLFKTFMLCYEFTNPDNGQRFIMKEELKIGHVTEVK